MSEILKSDIDSICDELHNTVDQDTKCGKVTMSINISKVFLKRNQRLFNET